MDKHSKSERKSPRQERSKTLVSAILEATARLLPGTGTDRLNTNRIAETAGVSVGSLYQYFPNKDAILTQLIEELNLRNRKRIESQIQGQPDATPEQLIDIVISDLVELVEEKWELIRMMLSEGHRLGQTPLILDSRERIADLAHSIFSRQPGALPVSGEELRTRVYILVHAIMGVVQSVLLTPDKRRFTSETLRAELSCLAKAYLLRHP